MQNSIRGRVILLAALVGGLVFLWKLDAEAVKRQAKTVPGYTFVTVALYNLTHAPHDPAQAGNGKHATRIVLQNAGGLATDRGGNIFIADRIGFIWRIDTTGAAKIIAGTGRRGLPHDGDKAIESDLGSPEGLAFDSRDRLYFADSINSSVFRIESDGTLRRVAGSGRVGDHGDGHAAVEASLYRPFDIRFDSADNLYIVDVGNHRIRKVDPQGIITTVAGSGKPGYSGDGGPATAARLREPYGAFLDSQDRLYIADSANNVIRLVDSDGVIRTIAGRPDRGYSGDGGPAANALFYSPQFLFIDDQGQIYVGDEHNNAIRLIDRSGSISTIIGEGRTASNADTNTVGNIVLNDPEAMLALSDGSLLILDGDNHRVIRIRHDGLAEHFAGKRADDAIDITLSKSFSENHVIVR